MLFFEVQVIFDQAFAEMLLKRGDAYMENQTTAYLVGNPMEFSQYVAETVPSEPDRIVGPYSDPLVAWLYDSQGVGLVAISQGASDSEVMTLAKEHYGEAD
jgi:hypothetical protein